MWLWTQVLFASMGWSPESEPWVMNNAERRIKSIGCWQTALRDCSLLQQAENGRAVKKHHRSTHRGDTRTRKPFFHTWECHCTSTCVTLHGGNVTHGQKLSFYCVSKDRDVCVGASWKNILMTGMNVFLCNVGQQNPRAHSSYNCNWISWGQPFSSSSWPLSP